MSLQLKMSERARREIATYIVEELARITPSPADLAALAAEIAEMASESIAYTLEKIDGTPREELFALLEGVRASARASSQATSQRMRQAGADS